MNRGDPLVVAAGARPFRPTANYFGFVFGDGGSFLFDAGRVREVPAEFPHPVTPARPAVITSAARRRRACLRPALDELIASIDHLAPVAGRQLADQVVANAINAIGDEANAAVGE